MNNKVFFNLEKSLLYKSKRNNFHHFYIIILKSMMNINFVKECLNVSMSFFGILIYCLGKKMYLLYNCFFLQSLLFLGIFYKSQVQILQVINHLKRKIQSLFLDQSKRYHQKFLRLIENPNIFPIQECFFHNTFELIY